MAKNDRIERKREPFELVKDEKYEVFKVEVVNVDYTIDRLGFELADSSGKKIGIIDYNNNFTLSSDYKEVLKDKGFNPDRTKVLLLGADSKINSIKENRVIETAEQHQIEEQERNAIEQQRQAKVKEEAEAKKKAEFVPQASSIRITASDIAKQYPEIKSWTIITDERFMDGVQPSDANGVQLDKENIIVARMNDKSFKILAKELGTDRIIDLTPQSRLINVKPETVNRVRANNDSEKGKMCEFSIPVLGNGRIAVRETSTGHIIVESIRDTADNEAGKYKDGRGDNKRETFDIDTLGNKATIEEYNRREDLDYGRGIDNASGKSILTMDEAYTKIPDIIKEKTELDSDLADSIRDEVMNNYVRNSNENPTLDELYEYVQNVLDEHENLNEDRTKYDDARTRESDALDSIENHRRRNTN